MLTPADALAKLLEVLDRMEIPYQVGGSVASSFHGVPRMTMDVDLEVDLNRDQVNELAELLRAEFYADASMMREALERGRAFNVIHMPSAYKFDLFPLQKDEYSKVEFGRRQVAEIRALGPEPIECAISSAEDTILRKLLWYRKGGETSERQWSDLHGVVEVSGDTLDLEYLRKWAEHLKVGDLLQRLLVKS